MTTTANLVQPGQTVRVLSGPKAGMEGVVASVREATQFRTLIHMVIIDFEDGGRTVREAHDPMEVVR